MSRSLGVVALFTALTLLFTFPLWTAPDTLLTDNGDPRLNAWILAWDAHALRQSPGNLFDANIFHPHDLSLALSEHLLGPAVLAAPVNWTGRPILAYNLVILLSFIVGGLVMAGWAHHLTGSYWAAIVSGVVWAFGPSRMDHLHQIQLLTTAAIPAALWALTAFVETRRRGLLLCAAAFLAAQYTAGVIASLIAFPLIGAFVVLAWARRPAARRGELREHTHEMGASALLLGAVILPLSWPYVLVNRTHGLVRTTIETARYSAEPRNFLAASWANRTPHMRLLNELFGEPEAAHFLGLTAAALAMAGLAVVIASARRDAPTAPPRPGWASRTARLAGALTLVAGALHVVGIAMVHLGWISGLPGQILTRVSQRADPAVWIAGAGTLWLLLKRPAAPPGRPMYHGTILAWCGVLAYLLSLGMEVRVQGVDLGNGPFRILYDWVPAYGAIRAPGRFGLAHLTFLAPIVGMGAKAVTEQARRIPGVPGAAVGMLLVGLLVWEYRTWPLAPVDGRPRSPEIYRALDELPGDDPVLHLPLFPRGRPPRATEYMIGSVEHWRPLVNGFSGFTPPDIAYLARFSPEEPTFWRLVRDRFPVGYVVVHRELMNDPEYRRLLALLQEPGSGWEPVLERRDAAIFRRSTPAPSVQITAEP